MTKGAAFVVGATGGLGRASVLALSRDWDGVAIGYHSGAEKAAQLATELSPGCEGWPVHCDLTDSTSVAAAIAGAKARFGRIGTVVFASGVAIEQPHVSRIEEAQWREVIETEVIGLTRVVAAALPVFREQGGGNFVIVVSVANYAFPPGDALSSVPKAAMESLGRAIAKEEGRHGIRANMVAPGIIDAGLGSSFLRTMYTPEIWEAQRKRIALQSFGSGEDIGEVVAFLASDRARYITGQTVIVDGGFSL
ncbi:SDR family oxidoreductase [Novosphingobium sp.]|uniref:SDR family NAD(P)-dependent oxidoreductase n=1 Tax=Novosphingobium sp. TaxID=1874826 RepID=UPI00286E42A3|nr:SDR family oxidoreductase [Novosphingobium sp.]